MQDYQKTSTVHVCANDTVRVPLGLNTTAFSGFFTRSNKTLKDDL